MSDKIVEKPKKKTVKCPKCNGTGKIGKEPCIRCKGSGEVELLLG